MIIKVGYYEYEGRTVILIDEDFYYDSKSTGMGWVKGLWRSNSQRLFYTRNRKKVSSHKKKLRSSL